MARNHALEWGRRIARRASQVDFFCATARAAGLAGVLPPAVWQRLPVERTFEVQLPGAAESFMYRSTYRDRLGRALYWRGLWGWEAETLSVFARLAASARLVVDIGAYTGVFSLLACAASRDGRVFAFEPLARNFRRLESNIAANQWQHRIQALQMAIADHSGSSTLYVPTGEIPGTGSLYEKSVGSVEKVPVELRTLDDLLSDSAGIDVVKIDVERAEHLVLAGMTAILEQWRPALIVECLPDGPYRAVEAIAQRFGYRFHHLRSGGPVRVPGIAPDPRRQFRNFLLETDRYTRG